METQSVYDETERRMLNRAYNTYEILSSGTGIGLVEGRLLDTAGSPVAGTEVGICRNADDALLYRAVTGEDGSFRIYVYMDDTACYLSVPETGEYRETTVYGLILANSTSTYSYSLTMHKLSGDEYPVTLCSYPAMEIRTEEGAQAAPVAGVTAYIREGAGACESDITATLTAGVDGMLHTNLPSGVYTAQMVAEGYTDTYLEFSVDESEVNRAAYMVPKLAEGQTAVVMTWEGDDIDLDMTLFTPHQSTNGDMDHIGGSITEDGHGNSLVADNHRGCEVMLVNSGERGAYKIYVNNYTDSQTGNYASDMLLHINVHIYTYNDRGFVADYAVPVGQKGVVWEAAEINGETVVPGQRVYVELAGKSWWLENKDKKLLRRKITYTADGDYVKQEWEYVYDDQGNLIEEVMYISGDKYGWTEYIYD